MSFPTRPWPRRSRPRRAPPPGPHTQRPALGPRAAGPTPSAPACLQLRTPGSACASSRTPRPFAQWTRAWGAPPKGASSPATTSSAWAVSSRRPPERLRHGRLRRPVPSRTSRRPSTWRCRTEEPTALALEVRGATSYAHPALPAGRRPRRRLPLRRPQRRLLEELVTTWRSSSAKTAPSATRSTTPSPPRPPASKKAAHRKAAPKNARHARTTSREDDRRLVNWHYTWRRSSARSTSPRATANSCPSSRRSATSSSAPSTSTSPR